MFVLRTRLITYISCFYFIQLARGVNGPSVQHPVARVHEPGHFHALHPDHASVIMPMVACKPTPVIKIFPVVSDIFLTNCFKNLRC